MNETPGYIYIIQNKDKSISYIGSTTLSPQKRYNKHKYNWKYNQQGTYGSCSFYNYIVSEDDWNNWTVSLLEECPVSLLKEKEFYHIQNIPCVNRQRNYFKSKEESNQFYSKKLNDIQKSNRINYFNKHLELLKEFISKHYEITNNPDDKINSTVFLDHFNSTLDNKITKNMLTKLLKQLKITKKCSYYINIKPYVNQGVHETTNL
jgi:ribosomal protein S18